MLLEPQPFLVVELAVVVQVVQERVEIREQLDKRFPQRLHDLGKRVEGRGRGRAAKRGENIGTCAHVRETLHRQETLSVPARLLASLFVLVVSDGR